MRPTLLAAVLLLTPAAGVAQVERYELGRRLKRFEAEWEKVTDPAARKRALAILPKASTQFLSLNLTEAARTVDDAYWALKSADPPVAGVRWLDSLCAIPKKRVVYGPEEKLSVSLHQLYSVRENLPGGATVRLIGPAGAAVAVSLDGFYKTEIYDSVRTDSPSDPGRRYFTGDGHITLVGSLDRVDVISHTVGVSILEDVRSDRVKGYTVRPRDTLEGASGFQWIGLITGAKHGDYPETDLPASAWADALPHLRQPYFTADRHGDHHLTVPTDKGIETACRVFVPPDLARDKPVPLVVALHGAGGSENMFFESYGAGHIVKECQKRGWLLVSPRSGLLGTPPVAAIVDKLAERYPIDRKRVFLVGHSMGAGQAIDLVQRHPGTFAAVANLGGGGRIRQKERFETLPVFVGVGTADFALKSSRPLVKALSDAGAKNVTAKEYPDLEHLLIVREALPDVFQMFDGVK